MQGFFFILRANVWSKYERCSLVDRVYQIGPLLYQ